MTETIRQLLERAGNRGITFGSRDPNLPKVRQEIQQLRKLGLHIKETMEGGSSFTPRTWKRHVFKLEIGK